MKRVLLSLAAVACLMSAGCCCCEGLFNCCNPCGSTCHRPCASPCSPCGGNSCGYGPTGYAAPVTGTAYLGPSGVGVAANDPAAPGPIMHTAAMMPAESLPTY